MVEGDSEDIRSRWAWSLEDDFCDKVDKVRNYLNIGVRHDAARFPRPFFIECAGPPSTGKSTTIHEVDRFLHRRGFKVFCPQEGAEAIRNIPRSSPLYNVRTGLYAVDHILDLAFEHQYDIVILERGVFDAYCWMEYLYRRGKLSEREKDLLQSFFLLDYWVSKTDVVFFMTCSLEVSFLCRYRIIPHFPNQPGGNVNPEDLKQLIETYQDVFKQFSEKYPQIVHVDVDSQDEIAMVQFIARNIIDLLAKRIGG